MQHEILLSLLSHSGNVIRPQGVDNGCFKVASDANFLTHAEKAAVDKTAALGHIYSELRQFSAEGAVAGEGGSLYARALRRGVHELLSDYAASIAKLEGEVLVDPTLGVSYIRQSLSAYYVTLPEVWDLCNEVAARGHGGAPLLNALLKRCSACSPAVHECLSRLLWHCHQVLYGQLSSWMLHGVLTDPCKEFFIQHNSPPHSDPLRQDLLQLSLEDAEEEWSTEYTLRFMMIPQNFPPSLAQKVLFVGKAVQALKQKTQIEGQRTHGSGVALSESDLKEFTDAWKALSMKEEFHLMSVERVVERVNRAVAHKLWVLVVVQAKLPLHLKAVRDYFLLGKGNFFHCLSEDGRDVMRLAPTRRTVANLSTGPFQRAGRACGLEDDEFFARVNLILEEASFDKKDFSSLAGFSLAGVAPHDPEAETVTLCACTHQVTGGRSLDEGTQQRAGALWCLARKPVGCSFQTSVSFRFDGIDEGSIGGLSLVLQNYRSRCLGRGGRGLGSEGIPRSIAVCLDLAGDASATGMESAAAGKESFLSVRTAQGTLGSVGVAEGVLRAGQLNVLSLECDPLPGAKICCRCYLNDSERRNPPMLTVEIAVDEALQLHGGGAYLGVTAGGDIPIYLLRWEFASAEQVLDVQNMLPLREDADLAALRRSKHVAAALEARAKWAGLQIKYRAPWPLHLILTVDALHQYNRLFALLFSIKRVSLEVDMIWQALMEPQFRELYEDMEGRQIMTALWVLRGHANFFLNTLQYYLQVDVIGAEYSALQMHLDSASDFNSVSKAHQTFLARLLRGAYLDVGTVQGALQQVLRVVTSFAVLFNGCSDMAEVAELDLQRVRQAFDKEVAHLFKVLDHVGATELVARLEPLSHHVN